MVGEISLSKTAATPEAGNYAAVGGSVPQRVPVLPDTSHTSNGQETLALSSPNVGKVAEDLKRLDGSNQVAQAIRASDNAMGQIGDALAKMKKALTQIVKQYPPYSMEDRERMQYLESVSGLRKEIEALSRSMPMPNGQSSAFEVAFAGGDRLTVSPVANEVAKIGIPVLTKQSSDAEVKTALSQVGLAEQRLNAIRTGVSETVRQATVMPDVAIGGLGVAFKG